jgi:hypothetical protein
MKPINLVTFYGGIGAMLLAGGAWSEETPSRRR